MKQYKHCTLLALSVLLVSGLPAFAENDAAPAEADKTAISAEDTAASATTEAEDKETIKKDAEAAEAEEGNDLKAGQTQEEIDNPLNPKKEETELEKAAKYPSQINQPVTGQNKQPVMPADPAQPDASQTNPEGKPLRGEAAPAVDPATSPNVQKLFSMFHANNPEKQAEATTGKQPSVVDTENN